MKILFWVSLLVIIYVYLGYPLLAYLFSLLYKKPLAAKYVYPTVSILISVHNEEINIRNKINSLMELDYPQDRLEIIFGSDGSTDGTEEIIKRDIEATRPQGHKVTLVRQEKRLGKPSMLNKLVKEAKGEILVFTDARQRLDNNALKELVKHFADGKVGSVSSELIYEDESPENKSSGGINLYWEYEKFIRKSESRMGSMLGATGALYAIRSKLFPGLPEDMILDDVYIPMKIVEKGYRAVFDSKAKIYDKVFSATRR
ncbi:MAG: glycosyltransferase family 2 protein [Candidatus Omnitrophota bacterium]|jgi:cellulose synthase/poly-beta-1,6-N-acetylglucosamine synthase-like glycosyltransferase|nr:MAG: glycosyltransferase family 2 protein [Candidatus Omnitrophota bacterium]